MRYGTVVVLSLSAGLLVPLICTAFSHFLTVAGVDPFSSEASTYRFVAALIWPTYIPFSLVTGAEAMSWSSACVLGVAALVNAVIYFFVATAFWYGLTEPRLRYLAIGAVLVMAAYWTMIVKTLRFH